MSLNFLTLKQWRTMVTKEPSKKKKSKTAEYSQTYRDKVRAAGLCELRVLIPFSKKEEARALISRTYGHWKVKK